MQIDFSKIEPTRIDKFTWTNYAIVHEFAQSGIRWDGAGFIDGDTGEALPRSIVTQKLVELLMLLDAGTAEAIDAEVEEQEAKSLSG